MSSPNVDGDAGQSILAGTMRQRARRGRGRRVHDDPPCMRNYILLYCALLGGARGRAVGGGRSFAGTTRSTDDDGWGMSSSEVCVRTGGFAGFLSFWPVRARDSCISFSTRPSPSTLRARAREHAIEPAKSKVGNEAAAKTVPSSLRVRRPGPHLTAITFVLGDARRPSATRPAWRRFFATFLPRGLERFASFGIAWQVFIPY